MAVVTRKSLHITNRDATPRVLTNSSISGGMLREAVGVVDFASGDSIGSKAIMATVPSNCRISEIVLYSDDIGVTTVADVGIYRTTEDGGALVNIDLWGSAVSLNAGALTNAFVQNESGEFDIVDSEKLLWQALGLTEDSKVHYDVVITLSAAADAAGTVETKVRFLI